MRTEKRLLCVLLLVTLMLSLGVSAMADRGTKTYTVRIYPGNNGTVSSGECLSLSGEYDANTRHPAQVTETSVSLGGNTITVNDEKYYIKGLRETGKDALTASNFVLTEDQDYVVAYGMRGDAKRYTVRYLDQNGQNMSEVAPESGVPGVTTGYASAGDKPVVGYYPIDGYLPYAIDADGQLRQTYNLTKTLSEDESENVFTFYYLPVPVNVVVEEEPAAEGAPPEDAEAEAAEDEELVEIGDDEVPLAAPEETVDLDDEDVPLAGPHSLFDDSDGRSLFINGLARILEGPRLVILIGAAVVILAALFWIIVINRRRRPKENNE